MEKYVINGGKPLHGSVDISGMKNAAVAVIFAAILTDNLLCACFDDGARAFVNSVEAFVKESRSIGHVSVF